MLTPDQSLLMRKINPLAHGLEGKDFANHDNIGVTTENPFWTGFTTPISPWDGRTNSVDPTMSVNLLNPAVNRNPNKVFIDRQMKKDWEKTGRPNQKIFKSSHFGRDTASFFCP